MKLKLVAAGDPRSSVLVVFPGGCSSEASVSDAPVSKAPLPNWVAQLGGHFSIYQIDGPAPQSEDTASSVTALQRYCEHVGLKRITVLGVEQEASLAMQFAIAGQRNVRRIVLVNATSRRRPGPLIRALDRFEELLPIGFPFRSLGGAYDARSHLHRIHCPTLIVTDTKASPFARQQAELLATRIPNGWKVELSTSAIETNGQLSEPLAELLLDFSQVPVKRPQKGIESRVSV